MPAPRHHRRDAKPTCFVGALFTKLVSGRGGGSRVTEHRQLHNKTNVSVEFGGWGIGEKRTTVGSEKQILRVQKGREERRKELQEDNACQGETMEIELQKGELGRLQKIREKGRMERWSAEKKTSKGRERKTRQGWMPSLGPRRERRRLIHFRKPGLNRGTKPKTVPEISSGPKVGGALQCKSRSFCLKALKE